jgi:hypothetical protein
MENTIEWTRVNNDVNGNPRYVCHFLNFTTEADNLDISGKYALALKRAKKLGGRKFHNKQYGGGIVFQSYNIDDLEQDIKALMAKLAID